MFFMMPSNVLYVGGSHGVLGAAIVGGFVLMLLVDHLQGGADHLPMSHHDTDDEEALRSVANASTAYSSHTRLQVRLSLLLSHSNN